MLVEIGPSTEDCAEAHSLLPILPWLGIRQLPVTCNRYRSNFLNPSDGKHSMPCRVLLLFVRTDVSRPRNKAFVSRGTQPRHVICVKQPSNCRLTLFRCGFGRLVRVCLLCLFAGCPVRSPEVLGSMVEADTVVVVNSCVGEGGRLLGTERHEEETTPDSGGYSS
ncbi:hypothetical protein BU26DRAFT_519270 [Trematosphaeria pertusa]|uniref:Uncharacterized protein n=1 Tax=Trematosphaeria pertusa TaxID=390896 RepID=A0A6A6IFA5_9PLEO|nr:uncharacterized protein BU26DRAFT_519270 [Trematosphaeria pertusa]KAF2249111.1 hypothetical protein BU26DRAFT_519270 [Trematosphaeria pertusa]